MPYDPTSEADIATAIQMARQPQQNFGDASDNAMMRQMVAGIGKPIPPAEPYEMGDTMAAMTQRGRRDISTGSATQADVKAGYPANTIIPQMSEEDRAKMREAAWQKLSGFGSTLYNAAASVIPEVLPSFVVGEPWQRKQLAKDIGAMPDAFAGMGSAIVGPSYERAANMSRKAMFPAGEEAITTALNTAKALPEAGASMKAADTVPEVGMLGVAEPAPPMARGMPMESKKTAPEGTFDDVNAIDDVNAVDDVDELEEVKASALPPPNVVTFPKGMKLPKMDPRDMPVVQGLGTTAEDQKLIAETIKRARTHYSPKSGFNDFEIVGGKFEDTKGGERIFVPKFKFQNYDFQKPPEGMKAPAWEKKMANSVVSEVSSIVDRAKAGDQAAVAILKEARWYRSMRERMRKEFGGLGDLFADLLGTTSAQTGVTQNWNNAIEIMRRFSRGEYDRELAAYERLLAEGKSTNPVKLQQEFKAGNFPLITKASGGLFNANSPASTRALLDMFRNIRAGVSPKTPNFTGNLIGYSNDATVDVWAARMLRRLSGKKPIPPAAEKAVGGKHTKKSTFENPSISGEFGFGQKVFQRAADEINKSGLIKNYDPALGDLGADDLQAVAWFLEKERWTNKGWTSKAGEGGSLDFEANLAGAPNQQRVNQLRQIITDDFKEPVRRKKDTDEIYNARVEGLRAADTKRKIVAQAELDKMASPLQRYTLGISRERPNNIPSNYAQAELAAPFDDVVREDPSVVAYQLNNTIGRFQKNNERALNAEFVVRSDFDPSLLERRLVEAGKEYNQDSVFISRVLRSADESPNARPGMEIYFSKKMPQKMVQDLSDYLTEKGIDGFTYITDARQSDRVNVQSMSGQPDTAGLTGLRFQFIPEFGPDIPPELWQSVMSQKATDFADIAEELMGKYPEISIAEPTWNDTKVFFNGDYDAYLGRTVKAGGGALRFREPVHSGSARQAGNSAIGQVGSADVYNRISRAAGQNWQDADIQAALNTARQNFGEGGGAFPLSISGGGSLSPIEGGGYGGGGGGRLGLTVPLMGGTLDTGLSGSVSGYDMDTPEGRMRDIVGDIGGGDVSYSRDGRTYGASYSEQPNMRGDTDRTLMFNYSMPFAAGGRIHKEGGGVSIGQDQIDQGIIAANQSLQELRGAKQAVRDQAFDEYASNRSWPEYASDVGRDLSAMKDIGLVHDIVPGAIQSVKQAATWPQREAQARASGAPFTPQQSIEEAVNAAGMLTLGAGAVPAEANSLRTGFTSRVAKTADLNAIREAESMSLKGYSPEEIWQKTGYFPHPGTQQQMGKPAKVVRYEQPVNFHVDVAKLQNAPTPDYKYMLPEVFNDDALFAAYPNPDYFKNVPVYARATEDDGITPMEGAKVAPMERGIGFFLQNTIDPAIIAMGDLSHQGYQASKGEIGALPHEINHILQDIELLPRGLPSKAGNKMMSDAFSDVLKRKNLSPADRAYYAAGADEFANYAQKNPNRTNYALYLHSTGEAMSRLAELFAARPELRKNFPLEHLDVNPDWMTTHKETSKGFQLTSDPMKALEAVRWAFTPEGTAAIKAYSAGTGTDMGISRQPGPYRASGGSVHDPVSSALRLAHEASQ